MLNCGWMSADAEASHSGNQRNAFLGFQGVKGEGSEDQRTTI